nr:hypothetical protein [Tanacetum cinerariifolium]
MSTVHVSGPVTPPRLTCKLAQIIISGKSYLTFQILPTKIISSQKLRSTIVHAHKYQSISNSMGNEVNLEHGATSRLAGKVALITGAAQGIGESTARLFAKHGANVVIADIQDDLGQSVAEDIGLEMASYIHCDVTLEEDVENAVNFVTSKYGKLDIVINNAAILGEAKLSILDNSKSDFDRVINVNLAGVFLGIKHAARAMIPTGTGSIISIELGKYGIRVNCVSPYLIPPSAPAEITERYPDIFANIYSNIKGTALKEEDVAQAALFFGSDESNLSTPAHDSTLNSLHKKMDFMMSIFKSDSKYSDMFSQFESGGASGSGGCEDEEEGADHQDDEDEDGDGDT